MLHEDKFSGLAAGYAQYRPRYPQALYDYLYTQLGLNQRSVIADIGAGTGIFCAPLLARGSTVLAVEPNLDMLRELERQLGHYGKLQIWAASAEDTGLPDGSADAVTVAQAFHWFDPESFREECLRLLKPGGLVVLVWNIRQDDHPLVQEQARLNARYCPNFVGFSGGFAVVDESRFDGFFRGGGRGSQRFANDLLLTEEQFLGRCLSSSYALRPADPQFTHYLHDLRIFFRQHQRDNLLATPNAAVAYWGRP